MRSVADRIGVRGRIMSSVGIKVRGGIRDRVRARVRGRARVWFGGWAVWVLVSIRRGILS